MVRYYTLGLLALLICVPVVTCNAGSHIYSLDSSSSVRYTDIIAYTEGTSTMQCLALCDGTDECTSINYNVDTERCELTPHVPRNQTPAAAAEPNWRVYYSDRIISAVQAWQPSTHVHAGNPLSASYAIDGNRDNNDHGPNLIYCAHTDEYYSYWAMEFKYVAKVEYVMIYFRNISDNGKDQNLRLLISTSRQDCDDSIGTDCATFVGPPDSSSPPTRVRCTQPVSGKFLKIMHNHPTSLVLCEVEAYFN